MKKLLFILLLIPLTALSATATLNWIEPTQYTDGTPLNPTNIKSYRIYYEIDATITESSTTVDVPRGTNTTIQLSLSPRETPYVANFAARTVLNDGRTSDFSNIVTKTIQVDTTANPNPPSTMTIEFTCNTGCTITTIP